MGYIKRTWGFVKAARSKGFFDIVISGTIAKGISFASVVVLSRLISKSDFGLLSYTDNIRNYVLLFGGLGLQNSILRFTPLARGDVEKERIFKTAFIRGCIINIFIAVGALTFFLCYGLPLRGASGLMVSMCFLPSLTFVFECSQLYLRANFFNSSFARLSVIYSASYMIFQMVPAFFWGLEGVVLGRYLSFAVTIAACIYFVPALRQLGRRVALDIKKFREILRYGMLAMLANCTSLIIPLNEVVILGAILKSTDLIAEYRAAAIFPQVLSFFSTAVITFVFPYFSKNQHDSAWLWSSYKRLIGLLSACLLPFILLLMAFPSAFLYIVYGSRYASGGEILRVLLVANAINICVRIPTGNILAAVGDVRFNFFNSLACSVLHIGAEILLVTRLGLTGSPVALALVYTSSSLAAFCFFRSRCKTAHAPSHATMAETKRRRKGAVNMKKLLFIAHVPIAQSQYGRHIKLFHQITALEKSGYDVDYIGNDGRFYYLCSKNAENMLTGAEKAGAESRPAFFTAVRLALEHGSGYDYAYICSEPFTPKFLGMLRRLKSLDIKVIMELQTYPYDKARLMEKRPFTRFRLLVDRLCRASLKRYVDVIASPSEDESIFSIPVVTFENSVEPGLIKRRNPSFHTKELHLLAFAGMEARNGYDRLIEGLRLYYATRQDFKIYLHLVGEGRLLTQWFRLAIRYGLGSYVIFHGEKYGAELDEIFDSCDLGVADLGVYRLGLAGFSGLNVSEYCARGLPFIYAGRELSLEAGVCFARRYPNTSEPVDIGSVVAFYKGVLQTANIGDRMFEFATAHYTWQKQFDGIFELLQNPTAGVEAIEDT